MRARVAAQRVPHAPPRVPDGQDHVGRGALELAQEHRVRVRAQLDVLLELERRTLTVVHRHPDLLGAVLDDRGDDGGGRARARHLVREGIVLDHGRRARASRAIHSSPSQDIGERSTRYYRARRRRN